MQTLKDQRIYGNLSNSNSNKIFIKKPHVWMAGFLLFCLICGLAINFFEPIVLVGIVGGLIGLVSLIIYPFMGVIGYFIYEYGNVSQLIPALNVLQVGKLIIIFSLAIWVIQSKIKGRLTFVSDPANWVLFIWLLAAFVSAPLAINSKAAFQGVFDLSKWFIIYIMIINLVDNPMKFRITVWVMLILYFKMSQFQLRAYGAGLEASGIFRDTFIREGLGVGSTSFFGNAGDFGVAMCAVIPLAFYLFKAEKNKFLKATALFFCLIFVMSLLRTGARGSIIGLLGISIVYWLRSSNKLRIGAIMVLSIIIFWVTAPDIVKNRFIGLTEEKLDGTATHRLELWSAGFKMLRDNPIFGVGINNFGENYATHYFHGNQFGQEWAPHNIFIQALSESGLIGLICLFYAIYLIIKRNYQTRQLIKKHKNENKWIYNFTYGLDLALIGYIGSGSFLSVLYYPHLFILFSLTVSLHHILKKRINGGPGLSNSSCINKSQIIRPQL